MMPHNTRALGAFCVLFVLAPGCTPEPRHSGDEAVVAPPEVTQPPPPCIRWEHTLDLKTRKHSYSLSIKKRMWNEAMAETRTVVVPEAEWNVRKVGDVLDHAADLLGPTLKLDIGDVRTEIVGKARRCVARAESKP